MNMYREDFENIFRKQGLLFVFCKVLFNQGHRSRTKDHYAKFSDFFHESIKQKILSLQQYASNSRNRLIWKPVLQKDTPFCCVLFIHKHDHVIYGATKVQT